MSGSRETEDPNERYRDPAWSEQQASIVEEMQCRRSSDAAPITHLDEIAWLKHDLEKARKHLAELEWLRNDLAFLVLPYLQATLKDRCCAPFHSPYRPCSECRALRFLSHWRTWHRTQSISGPVPEISRSDDDRQDFRDG